MLAMKNIRVLIALIVCLAIGNEALPKEARRNGHAAVAASKDIKDRSQQHHRVPREIRMLKLKDPLDCLSQVICGLNTFPPEKPNVRSSTANDFAYLMKNAINKLRSQRMATTTTTTTAAPATSKRTTTKAPLNDDDDEYDDDTIENDMDYESDPVDDYYDGQTQQDPPPMPIDRRRGRKNSVFNEKKKSSNNKSQEKYSKKHSRTKKKQANQHNILRPLNANMKPVVTLSPLDRLRMETNLRAKLLSDAQCQNGLNDHPCPFNYQQMLSLISSSLERERTVSYTTNKVLPMVGYLIKSRNYTGTLAATFQAIERIDNYTIEADREGKPIDFSHILDEVLNRNTGDNGLRIVDTSNDSASSSVWEDDEFDHVLQNPYVRKRPGSDNYKLSKKQQEKKQQEKKKQEEKRKQQQKQKVSTENDDQSTTSEEDTSEEGLVFDRPRPPPRGPPGGGGPDNESTSEEDDQEDPHSKVFESGEKKNKFSLSDKEKLKPPPVFGHLQKSAEDE